MSPQHGEVYGATLETDKGEVRETLVVVSRNAINERMNVVLARITSREKYRVLPSSVEVSPDQENGLSTTSFVLCHDLYTLPHRVLDPRPKGRLGVGAMIEVHKALRYSLDLD